MRTLPLGLSDQAPVVVYDETKPYLAGRAFSKTLDSIPVYGPPLTGFVNTQLDTAAAPVGTHTTANGRMFVLLPFGVGVVTIALYNVDLTGQVAPAYVGRIIVRLPNSAATTHTMRGFEVYDGPNPATVTGWQIFIGTTGTVLINAGLFMVNDVAFADFSPISPPTIEMAIANGAKAVYMFQDPGSIGVANTLTAMQGIALDKTSRRIYFHNNVLATTQFAVFDTSVSPTVTGLQTASAVNVNAGVTTFNFTAHGFANNTPVVLLGTVPTGFTASTASAAQTVYFIRNAAANTFELSLTSGGASILGTSVVAGTQVVRAFGQSTAQWLNLRTGTVTGFAGVILITNCERIVTPSQALDPAIPAAVDGQVCLFFATTTNFYLIKVSEITNGATTFPTMVTVNAQGTGTDYASISVAFAQYSEVIGRIIFTSNVTQLYIKRWINASIDGKFGALNTTYLENPLNKPYTFSAVALINLEVQDGWMYYSSNTVGQRGILYMDLRSDAAFNYSFVTTPVIDTSLVQFPKTIQTVEAEFDLTAPMAFAYKTAATAADVIFDDPTTGWTAIAQAEDLQAIALNNFSQFKVAFDIAVDNVNTPAQINELFLSYFAKNELSDYWSFSNENSTQDGVSPAYTAFRLTKAYAVSVPKLYYRAYDDAGALVLSANTVDNPTLFEYSTNNGTSWNALGTIANTALTTEVRYKHSSPSGVNLTSTIGES